MYWKSTLFFGPVIVYCYNFSVYDQPLKNGSRADYLQKKPTLDWLKEDKYGI